MLSSAGTGHSHESSIQGDLMLTANRVAVAFVWLWAAAGTVSGQSVADFTGNPLSGQATLNVTFTDNSSYDVKDWEWTFYGGTPGTKTGKGPHVIQYKNAGSYNVKLVVTGRTVDTKIKTNYINVQSPPPPEMDFGDAPDSPLPGNPISGFFYPTSLANDGARHGLVDDVRLGREVDSENDAHHNEDATGDDSANDDDEDGVHLPYFFPGEIAEIDVEAVTGGYLNAWMDFNGDGDWEDADEQIFDDEYLNHNIHRLEEPVPGTAVPGLTFARFRFSSQPGLSFTGMATNGEVEDYQIAIMEQIDLTISGLDIEHPYRLNRSHIRADCSGGTSGASGGLSSSVASVAVGATDGHVPTFDDIWQIYENVPIDADGILQFDQAVDIPDTLPEDNYMLFAVIDPYQVVQETDEDNNLFVLQTELFEVDKTPLPDLVVYEPVVMPDSGSWDPQVTVKIGNQGNADASAPFTTRIYWSNDDVLSVHDTELAMLQHVGSIEKVRYDSTRVSLSLPDGLTEGLYYILIDADSDRLGEEMDQQNNTVAIPFHYVESLLDYGDAPDCQLPGDPMTGFYYPTLAASNGASHAVSDQIYLGNSVDIESDGQPDTSAAGDDLNGDDEDGVVVPYCFLGDTVEFEVETFGSGYLNGWIDFNDDGDWEDEAEHVLNDTLLFTGTHFLEVIIPETGDACTTFARFRYCTDPGLSFDGPGSYGEVEDYRVEIYHPVDLYASTVGFEYPHELHCTQMAIAYVPTTLSKELDEIELEKIGSSLEGATGATTVLSENPIIDMDDQVLHYGHFVLDSSGTSSVNEVIDIPSTLSEGSYYIGLIIDPDNVIPEIDETNNTILIENKVMTIDWSPLPDLVVHQAEAVPDSGLPGMDPVLIVKIGNQGNTDNSTPFTTRVFWSEDSLLDLDDTELLDIEHDGNIMKTEYDSTQITVPVPEGVPLGQHYIILYTDAENEVTEIGGNNNTGVVPYVITDFTGVENQKEKTAIPAAFDLKQNYPNPFNPETAIEYHLPESGEVSLVIYDLTGREVRKLVRGLKPAGIHKVLWNGRDESGDAVGSGMYFYRISFKTKKGQSYSRVYKMIFLK